MFDSIFCEFVIYYQANDISSHGNFFSLNILCAKNSIRNANSLLSFFKYFAFAVYRLLPVYLMSLLLDKVAGLTCFQWLSSEVLLTLRLVIHNGRE